MPHTPKGMSLRKKTVVGTQGVIKVHRLKKQKVPKRESKTTGTEEQQHSHGGETTGGEKRQGKENEIKKGAESKKMDARQKEKKDRELQNYQRLHLH